MATLYRRFQCEFVVLVGDNLIWIDCQIEDLPNWLGVLLSEILEEVAAVGPEEINAHPETIKQLFDRAMYELFDSLSLYRRVVGKLPFSIVDEMEKMGVPKPHNA